MKDNIDEVDDFSDKDEIDEVVLDKSPSLDLALRKKKTKREERSFF